MTPRQRIDSFLTEKTLAVVGVSRSRNRFGNTVFNELKDKGFTVYPVNPNAGMIGEDKCYPDLTALPAGVGGVIVVVKPEQTEQVVSQAKEAGIKKVWMQQGSQSQAAIEFCEQNGIETVSRRCILMFAEPVGSIHKVHRFFARLFGAYPKKTA